ncbi:hypothetical protein BH09ACT11_BH09ACT11_13060 [soil metagenome]
MPLSAPPDHAAIPAVMPMSGRAVLPFAEQSRFAAGMLSFVDSETLAVVVSDIASAVARAGLSNRAAWLQQRAEDLRVGDTDVQEAARYELRLVLPGMGGLTDIQYVPDDRDRVDALIQEMWLAVRDDR